MRRYARRSTALAACIAALAVGCSNDLPRLDAAGDVSGSADGRAPDGPGGSSDALQLDAPSSSDASPSCPPDPAPPGAASCPTQCTGGCAEGVCTIDCTGVAACDGVAHVCPPQYACEVICEGADACDTGSVACPAGYACSLTCRGGRDACGDMDLRCGDASCSLRCAADACTGATVRCGPGRCAATCEGSPAPTLPT